MDTVSLDVQKRDVNVKARDIRESGLIPAVYYGAGQETLPLQMDYQTFRRVYEKTGESTIIDLHLDDGKTLKVLVHNIQTDPVYDTFRHIDFLHVDMAKEVTTHVALEFEGEAPAVKDLGGILTINKHNVEVRCLPDKLPHNIVVDISSLADFRHSIHVSDIQVPSGVEILDAPEVTLVTVTAPRVEEEEPAPAEVKEGEAAEDEKGEVKEDEEKEGESAVESAEKK